MFLYRDSSDRDSNKQNFNGFLNLSHNRAGVLYFVGLTVY